MALAITLTRTAELAIKGLSTAEKKELAKNIGVDYTTFYRWIKVKHDNLSKASVAKAIADKIGLPEDQILVQD